MPWQWTDDGIPKSAMTIIAKDVGIVMDEARLETFPAPLCSVAEQVFTGALGAGLFREDDGNVVKLWERFGVPSVMDTGSEKEEVEKAKELVVQAGSKPTKVLFIGLGAMGLPMASTLVQAGLVVVGYDTAPKALDAFKAAGGATTSDVKAGAEGADVVVFATVSAAQAESVLLGPDGKSGIAEGEHPVIVCQLMCSLAGRRDRRHHLDHRARRCCPTGLGVEGLGSRSAPRRCTRVWRTEQGVNR